jgi:hypothetical protein
MSPVIPSQTANFGTHISGTYFGKAPARIGRVFVPVPVVPLEVPFGNAPTVSLAVPN